ncbi:hypothetical protein FXV83_39320 [Bradyrhizobium hipponense]|uniref:Uncharacterized protein n=1 Tax=Bradyrhizobium hipponense TaxID=2605638 RepID=A0A5S4YCK5_9BRAD|nr:hypothetical protein [Bradyrhizobium hipponense]TYO61227.1 hypothetical protein FXV83_39320 [Bradyrhizobium hipponense]
MVEETNANSLQDRERQLALTTVAIRNSFSANPADAFLWLLFYSAQTATNGFQAEYLSYVERSYQLGPREGWIALRRNRMALAMFPFASESLRDMIVSEFVGLVDAGLIEDAASNLTGVGWPYKDLLLASLETADIVSREAFAKRLVKDGVKVPVPGVQTNERPW